jgi:predicted DNA binding CopG/RHH family protein
VRVAPEVHRAVSVQARMVNKSLNSYVNDLLEQSRRHDDDLAGAVELGERVADFLPRPEELVLRNREVEVTITLSEDSVDFFKEQAERLNVPYQRMLRNLVDEYVRQMRKGSVSSCKSDNTGSCRELQALTQ